MGARILCACANGSGTALMMQLSVERAASAVGMAVSLIHHCPLQEGRALMGQYDVLCVPASFEGLYRGADEAGCVLIPLDNVLSDAEVARKFRDAGLDKRFPEVASSS